MSTELYLGFILLAWIISEMYLKWINYKARFKYKLLEGSSLWRWFDNKVGPLSLLISSIYKIVVFTILSFIFKYAFNLPTEIVIASVISFFLGFTMVNFYFDKQTVKAFEGCLECEIQKECDNLLNKNCKSKYLKNMVKMAVQLEKQQD